ncbi:winged helix-turn-helix transcriptional regulator [Streptomyces triticiradicis]|uniref:Helix-turn-helix transcriptional regulator n=1 Tax=Streptomyces triticiradicis TaxID=2651189 RepID=A0A7J5D2S8_9ACTN|nr:helix-turn-helix domain-containing protein [Streptomyces triticiradicis]KAB1977767.1 helix-turn-helix transcriptional regulator [Streptomyces triticiradicis]
MRRTSFDSWPCSIARTVDILGDGWTLLILREVFYGESRFDGFIDSLGIARNTLTDRLRRLEDAGLLQRRPYQSEPVRHDYLPTDKGRDFFGVLAAINTWGDRWLADDGIPVVMHHTACGHDAQAEVVCSACGEPLHHQDVAVRTGPGYPVRLLDNPDVQARFAMDGHPEQVANT